MPWFAFRRRLRRSPFFCCVKPARSKFYKAEIDAIRVFEQGTRTGRRLADL